MKMKRFLTISFTLSCVAFPVSSCLAGQDQNLLEIYRQAQSNDPAWASAQSSNLAAQEKQVQGRALTLPTVTAGASANHSNTNIDYPGVPATPGGAVGLRNGRESFETYGYNLNLTQPLYRKQNSVQYEQSKTAAGECSCMCQSPVDQLGKRRRRNSTASLEAVRHVRRWSGHSRRSFVARVAQF